MDISFSQYYKLHWKVLPFVWYIYITKTYTIGLHKNSSIILILILIIYEKHKFLTCKVGLESSFFSFEFFSLLAYGF